MNSFTLEVCNAQVSFHPYSISLDEVGEANARNNARYFSANSPHAIANNGTIKENQEGDRDV
jgi:hypothetical protein